MGRKAEATKLAACLITAACAVALCIHLLGHPGHWAVAAATTSNSDYSRTDFVAALLSAISVILATLGIVLALAGAVGYIAIRDMAKRSAQVSAERVATRVAREVSERLDRERNRPSGDDFVREEGGEQ